MSVREVVPRVIRVEVTITDDTGWSTTRLIMEALAEATIVEELAARAGEAFPEFKTVDWYMDYLPSSSEKRA